MDEGEGLMIRVLLVTTWDQPCGIAEHSFYLKQAVKAADPEIQIVPWANLDPAVPPEAYETPNDPVGKPKIDLVHLNYQAALHSRWTPEWIRHYQKRGLKIVVTYHDTGVPNSDQCKALYEVADSKNMTVH